MRRTHLATFERPSPVLDHFIGERSQWEEVTKEWIALNPVEQTTSSEMVNDARVIALSRFTATLTCSPTVMGLDPSCRMKVAKFTPVNESEPNSDENFRIFQIADITNIREQNRELQLLVIERT